MVFSLDTNVGKLIYVDDTADNRYWALGGSTECMYNSK